MGGKLISVVIVSYNEEKFIGACLESITNQTIPRNSYEVIVVDGRSTDNTIPIAKRYADKVLVGYCPVGKARDVGLRRAAAPVVAFTDADTFVPPNWLEQFIKAFENPAVVGAYGGMRYIEQTPLARLYDTGARALIGVGRHIAPFFHGFNLCVRRSTALYVGGFKKTDLHEDFLMGEQLKKRGKVVFVPVDVRTSFRRLEKEPVKTLLQWFGIYEIAHKIKLVRGSDYNKELR